MRSAAAIHIHSLCSTFSARRPSNRPYAHFQEPLPDLANRGIHSKKVRRQRQGDIQTWIRLCSRFAWSRCMCVCVSLSVRLWPTLCSVVAMVVLEPSSTLERHMFQSTRLSPSTRTCVLRREVECVVAGASFVVYRLPSPLLHRCALHGRLLHALGMISDDGADLHVGMGLMTGSTEQVYGIHNHFGPHTDNIYLEAQSCMQGSAPFWKPGDPDLMSGCRRRASRTL